MPIHYRVDNLFQFCLKPFTHSLRSTLFPNNVIKIALSYVFRNANNGLIKIPCSLENHFVPFYFLAMVQSKLHHQK